VINRGWALFARADPRHVGLRPAVRAAVFAAAAAIDDARPFIFTDALGTDAWDRSWFEGYREFAARQRLRFAPVTLDIAPAENARRLVDPGRAARGKLLSPDTLGALRSAHQLLIAPGAATLDVTYLAPDQAARALVALLAL